MSPQSRVAAVLAAALVLAAAGAGCDRSRQRQPREIETVDVAPAIDADYSTEGDLQAVRRGPEIAGVVPGGVPPDLPLFLPSSVVDFGDLGPGRSYVEFDTSSDVAAVRRWLGERLPAAGWTASAVGGEGLRAAKGAREVTYRLTDLSPGTRIRLEYRPQP